MFAFADIRKLFRPGNPEVGTDSLPMLSKTEQTKLQAIQEAMTGDTDLAEMLGIPLDRLMELAGHMPAPALATTYGATPDNARLPQIESLRATEALQAIVDTLRAENARLQAELSLLREANAAATEALREQNRRDCLAYRMNAAVDTYLRGAYPAPTKR